MTHLGQQGDMLDIRLIVAEAAVCIMWKPCYLHTFTSYAADSCARNFSGHQGLQLQWSSAADFAASISFGSRVLFDPYKLQ